MTTLSTIFRAILSDLQKVIAPIAAKERTRTEFLVRVWQHLNRTIQRFEKLVAHWRAGTLPKPGKPRPGRKQYPQTTPRLPTGHAWLVRAVNHYNARAHASQLQHFLATPEIAKFLAEVPRAARILRPLAKSLGIPMPGDPPPPAPKPSYTPDPPPNPWRHLPEIGVRVLTAADPLHPNFSKAR